VAGTLKLDLAQFRELEAFATFGSELDKVSQAQLDRGYRLTELLKQGLNQPVPVEEQVLVIFAGSEGYVDDIPVADVQRYETEVRAYFRANHSDILDGIRTSGKLPEGDVLADDLAVSAAEQLLAGSDKQVVVGGPDPEIGPVLIELEHEVVERREQSLEAGLTFPERFVAPLRFADINHLVVREPRSPPRCAAPILR